MQKELEFWRQSLLRVCGAGCGQGLGETESGLVALPRLLLGSQIFEFAACHVPSAADGRNRGLA